MADPTGLSTVLAGKVLDATIGYVKTANRYNARHRELEDLVHTTGAFLQACPSGIARPIVQRVFQDVQPLHTGAQVLVRKRQDWEDKTTTFDRHLRLHTRWKLSKNALDHTQKIRTTEADRLPRAILVSVLDLQKELKSLRADVQDIKSSLGHESGACKQGTISREAETLKHEKSKQKTTTQEKDDKAATEKGMDTARADCIAHFSRGVRNIQGRLTDSIVEVGHDAFSDVIEGAMRDVVNLHLESIRSAQNTRLCPSSSVASESWDSLITRKSFRDGGNPTNAVLLAESTGEIEHVEAEETELGEVVGRIENEGRETKMAEVKCIEQLSYGPTRSQYIVSREISYAESGNFTFEALMTATDNFANLIGRGGSSDVYRGCLPDGSRIAVKRTRPDFLQRTQGFSKEIRCSFDHPALVKILGWCAPALASANPSWCADTEASANPSWCADTEASAKSRWLPSFFSKRRKALQLFTDVLSYRTSDSDQEQCLVMEYFERGSLHDHLFDDNGCDLEWPVRLKICIGAAGGISFLHKLGIVHRDIKPGNILLDENFSPKITDFGISHFLSESTSGTTSDTRSPGATEIMDHRGMQSFMSSALSLDFECVTTAVRGTVGYIDPEYFDTSKIGPKSDVFSFGVTLLNVLSGSRAYYFREPDGKPQMLLEQATILFRADKVGELIDPKMERTIEDVNDFEEVVRIALLCSEYKYEDRPTMDEVHSMLLKVGSKGR